MQHTPTFLRQAWALLAWLFALALLLFYAAPPPKPKGLAWRLGAYAVVLAGLWLLLQNAGCSRAPMANVGGAASRPDPAQAAVVVMCPETVAHWSDLSEDSGTLSLERELKPCCSGFAAVPTGPRVGTRTSAVGVVTAAHCLSIDAKIGSDAYYVTHDDWYDTARAYSVGRVVRLDRDRDWAVLEPVSHADAEQLARAALDLDPNAPAPKAGTTLVAWEGYREFRAYRGELKDTVLDLQGARVATTVDVQHGASGSPVLAERGQSYSVVGIVHGCTAAGRTAAEQARTCEPRTGIYASTWGLVW